MRSTRAVALPLVLCLSTALAACRGGAAPVAPVAPGEPLPCMPGSDPRAVALAQSMLDALGGRAAWDATRHVRWDFFVGLRRFHWDKWTGAVRLESGADVVLFDVDEQGKSGRAFRAGAELAGAERDEALAAAYAAWINDMYWLFMPYKLFDPGVQLAWLGPGTLLDGSPSERIAITYEQVGLTPKNRYVVHVCPESRLVQQWDFYESADDAEPKIQDAWLGWQRFGAIRLPTRHTFSDKFVPDHDWRIAVFDELDPAVYTSPSARGG